jgi:hypothetical protein
VKRINSSYFLDLGGYLNHLKTLNANSPWTDNYGAFILTEIMLGELLDRKEPIEVTYCLNDAEELRKYLCSAIEKRSDESKAPPEAINTYDVIQSRYLAETFEKALTTELHETNTYFVSPVGDFLNLGSFDQSRRDVWRA